MAVNNKGRKVVWGIAAGVITGAHTVTTAGILQGFSIQAGGETGEIKDEDGDIVTRIGHGAKNKVTVEILCEPTSKLPLKDAEMTGLGTLDGLNFSTGRVFVDDATVTYANADVKKISVNLSHYPEMAADPA
jgi:hypothetical protein